jgi:DNA-binding IclR family transcriptional regulator
MPSYKYIQAISRAVDILELVGNSPDGMGLSEIAGTMGLARQTIHNILRTLVHKGLLDKTEHPPRYLLSAAMEGMRMKREEINRGFIRRAVPVMLRLARQTRADAILSHYTGGEVVGRVRATPEPDEQPVLRYSWRMNPYGSGLLFQAWMDPAERAEYRVAHPLADYDPGGYWRSTALIDKMICQMRSQPCLAYIRGGILRAMAPVFRGRRLLACVGIYKSDVTASSDCGARQCISAAVAAARELSESASPGRYVPARLTTTKSS